MWRESAQHQKLLFKEGRHVIIKSSDFNPTTVLLVFHRSTRNPHDFDLSTRGDTARQPR